MITRVVRSVGSSVLGLALLASLAGCQADNEAGVNTGEKGTADPKYSGDESYQQYAKDVRSKKIEQAPGKVSAPAKKK